MVCVTLALLVITVAVLATRGCGGSGMARCNDCCLIRFGSIFIALAVLLAVTVAGGETATGVVIGSFCENIDTNVLAWAKHGMGDSPSFHATNYYLTGAGDNPLERPLLDAKSSLTHANETLSSMYTQYGAQIQVACSGWTATAAFKDVNDISDGIAAGEDLISRRNVYPYYNEVVTKDVCSTVIASIGWLVIVQL